MNIYDLRDVWHQDTAMIHAQILPDGNTYSEELWYRFQGLDGPAEPYADPFVTAMLPFCMLEGEPCRIEGVLSARLQSNLPRAQNVLSQWYDYLDHVRIDLQQDEVSPRAENGRGVACYFNGGVGSWHALLRNLDRVTHLYVVRGFDIGLDDQDLWEAAYARYEWVAKKLGKQLIVCETNLRDVADRDGKISSATFEDGFWGECLSGAALASCSQTLGETICEFIVPASQSHKSLKPRGCSPRLDRFWSNGTVKVTVEGADVERSEKIREIAENGMVTCTLRVCRASKSYDNCGTCERCVRTKLALKLCGALGRVETFPSGTIVPEIKFEPASHLVHDYGTLLYEALRSGNADIVRAIKGILGERLGQAQFLALHQLGAKKMSEELINNRQLPDPAHQNPWRH